MCEQEGFIREQITLLDKQQPIKPENIYTAEVVKIFNFINMYEDAELLRWDARNNKYNFRGD